MSQIFVDGSMLAKFASQTGEVQVCDGSGRVLGVFVPASEADRELRELYEDARTRITDEELERARQQPGGYTTAEVLEYLRTL
ncbi:MAG: hypothetical protein ABI353_24395 [Isosphaeraceae bacterium]